MSEEQETARVKELKTKLDGFKEGVDGVATALADFEKASKSAFTLAEKYLQPKKGGLPDDTVKKVDELKQSVTAFDTASKALVTGLTTASQKLTAQKALLEAEVESARMEDETETPEYLKKQVDAMKVELQRLVDERQEVESTLHEQMTQIQTQSNEEKQELVRKYTESVNGVQRQLEEATDKAAILSQKLVVEQESVTTLKAALDERDAKIKELISKSDRLEAEATLAAQSAKDFKLERDTFSAQLKVAETCRANEFKAFERAIHVHETENIGFEKKIVDLQTLIETLKTEKEAMRARLVDDHLREHIRILQEENNKLREERIQSNHARSTEKIQGGDLSAILAAQLKELGQERQYYEKRVEGLSQQLAATEKSLFDATVSLETERSDHAAKMATLERKLMLLQLSPEKVKTHMAEAKSVMEAPIVTRHVSVQATDNERKELASQVSLLEAKVTELTENLDLTERHSREQRAELERKMILEAEESAAVITSLQHQLKVAKYKLEKAQKERDASASAAARSESALSHATSVHADDALSVERKQKLEKRAVEAALEAEGLRVKVRTLQRDLAEQRQFYEQKLEEVRDGADAGSQHRTQSEPNYGSPSPVPTTKSNRNGVPEAEARARKQLEIDDKLLKLHEESIKLNERESAIEAKRVASENQLKDRLRWLESGIQFWQSPQGAGQFGPEGETSEMMIGKLSRDISGIETQLKQLEDGMLRFFKEIGDRRTKIFEASTQLLKERAAL